MERPPRGRAARAAREGPLSLSALLRARATELVRAVLSPRPGERTRNALFLVLLVAFVIAARYLSFRVFSALLVGEGIMELIGTILAIRLIALFLLLLWGMLVFGALLVALENFYYADDIDFLVEKPIPLRAFCLWKAGVVTLESSWVVLLVALPVFSGYGAAVGAQPGFLLISSAVLILLILPPVLASSLGVFGLLRVVPLDRAKEILVGAGFLLSLGMVGTYRLLSPARVFDTGRLTRDFVGFLDRVQAPVHPLLPSNVAADALLAGAGRNLDRLATPMGILFATAFVAVAGFSFLAPRLYRPDRPISREARRPGLATRFLGRRLATPAGLAIKEALTYLRDPTQISHLFLLGGVLVLHLVNLRELPVSFDPRARALLAFLNLGLAGFLLSAVVSRFVYPALSLEGRPIVLLLAAPMTIERLLFLKWFVAAAPLLLLTEAVVWVSNGMVRAPLPLSLAYGWATAWIVATTTLAGAAAGVLAPRFETNNVFEISASSGGILFILMALLYLLASIVLLVPTTWAVTFSADPWAGLFHPRSLAGLAAFTALSAFLCFAAVRAGRWEARHLAERHPEVFA